ncbi:MAG: sn-glycerol-3-phosphate ABC transporter ATP-binding protein UgpC [Acidimicrobiales bacterium]
MARVNFDGVSKAFDGSLAVDDLSMEVLDGELLVLLGPSGCGKTTALRMVAGLEDPTGGTVSIGDTVVNDVEPKDRDVAMVFQSYALYPHMTLRRNIEFPLRQQRIPADERGRRAEEAAATLGLGDLLDRKPGQLSGGQRQRVALARAIVRDPKVFLMDEPLSNLDATLRIQTRADIVALQRRLGTTTIYVTHDQVEAMTMGHRIAVMRDGRLQQVAAPQDLYERPGNTFVASFLGSPGMNLLPARCAGGVLSIDGASIDLGGSVAAIADGPVTLGVRPESASLDSTGIAASVVLVEQLGAETHVICALADGTRVVVRQRNQRVRPDLGDPVAITVDPEALHFFDAETGERLDVGR